MTIKIEFKLWKIVDDRNARSQKRDAQAKCAREETVRKSHFC